MAAELSICILSSEGPLDARARVVAVPLPRGHFAFESLAVGQPPVQALAAQNADLDFGHVQPARMRWRVMKDYASQQAPSSGFAQNVLKAPAKVRIEIVGHQMNAARRAVYTVDQVSDKCDEVGFAAVVGNTDGSATGFWFDSVTAHAFSA